MGKKVSGLMEWVGVILGGALIALLLNKFVVFAVIIPTESMEPTLMVNDRLIVTRIYDKSKIQRGDIIVLDCVEKGKKYIKRVMGLPGDKIELINGVLYVNGEMIEEPYIGSQDFYTGEFEVPEGKYFMLGDNRGNSEDSRYLKNPYIDEKDILGKAQIKIYPFSDIGKLK